MPNRRTCWPRWLRAAPGIWVWLAVLLGAPSAQAQRHLWQNEAFDYRHTVEVPPERSPSIVVCQFLTHGQLRGDPRVTVYGHKEVRPHRILQAGPEDFCRVAFQTTAGERQYFIYFGCREPDQAGQSPAWTAPHGLLLETRRWKACNLNDLDDVRRAFSEAQVVGSDYVNQVFHRHNPFDPAPEPFLSHYTGRLETPTAGQYSFYTSSQDCSFLLIDGRQVVAAPGQHPPDGRARVKGQITLKKGPHDFQYWHAAAGEAACMVAAWQAAGAAKPEAIPPTAFGNAEVAHVAPGLLEHRTERVAADFQFSAAGDCPLELSDQWMVRVQFSDATDPKISRAARHHWDFGDGQTSQQREPTHVYLHPGRYQVSLSVRRGTRTLTASSWVQLRRPTVVTGQKPSGDKLEDYLPLLAQYEPSKLDLAGLVQLVRAHLQSGNAEQAVQAGEAALLADHDIDDPASHQALLELLGPVARDQLHDPQRALQLWLAAGKRGDSRARRIECALQAADIYIHDLLQHDRARPYLEYASKQLQDASGPAAARLHGLRGAWHARRGEGQQAREAYDRAARIGKAQKTTIERNAWRGARSRSVEAFLRSGELDRAVAELRQWEADFPLDRTEGYLSLLWARYWVARQQPAHAIAVGNDLLAVNPRSAYADQLLQIVAQCELDRGRAAQARAAYQSLATDYPGSPLAPQARAKLDELPADDDEPTSPE